MDTKRKIQIGLVYSTKVGGAFLPVRIDKSLGHGRYEGVCMPDGKTVKIATDAVKGGGETLKQWEAKRTLKQHDEPVAAPAAKTEKRKAAARVGEKKDHKSSGLDAAAKVLAEAGEPLNTKTMVERMLSHGLWKTSGKTPAATIYAAIIREIATKGSKARFKKVERGKFEAVK